MNYIHAELTGHMGVKCIWTGAVNIFLKVNDTLSGEANWPFSFCLLICGSKLLKERTCPKMSKFYPVFVRVDPFWMDFVIYGS